MGIFVAKNTLSIFLLCQKSLGYYVRIMLHEAYTYCHIKAKYCPIITNHTSMERLFIQLLDDNKKFPYDWFCGPASQI